MNPRDRGFDVEVAAAWLQSKGYSPDTILRTPETGAASRACLEIWLNEKRAKPAAELEKGKLSKEDLEALAQTVYKETNVPRRCSAR